MFLIHMAVEALIAVTGKVALHLAETKSHAFAFHVLRRSCEVGVRADVVHRWTYRTTYLTTDSHAIGSRVATDDEVLEGYGQCPTLRRPPGRCLYAVDEVLRIFVLSRRVVGVSDLAPNRVRLMGWFTDPYCLQGNWFDTKPRTMHKGPFLLQVASLDYAAATAVWCGPDLGHGPMRIFPWLWKLTA